MRDGATRADKSFKGPVAVGYVCSAVGKVTTVSEKGLERPGLEEAPSYSPGRQRKKNPMIERSRVAAWWALPGGVRSCKVARTSRVVAGQARFGAGSAFRKDWNRDLRR